MKMLDDEKELWAHVLASYKEMTFLWDVKDKNYVNKKMRAEGYKKLLERYLKIDKNGTIEILKRRLDNMRTAYNRERRKVRMSLERDMNSPHIPTLWYYKQLSFLDALPMHANSSANTPREHYFNFNRFKNKIYLEKRKKKSLKRLREEAKSVHNEVEESRPGYINIEPLQSSEEEVQEPPAPRPQPKRRIFNLLQKQERFVETATKMLGKKEKDWEIIGKAIGLQLSALEGHQQTIAQKLISDAIFYGNMGKLNIDSCIHIESFETVMRVSPELTEETECKDDLTMFVTD
ncbi:hypothetical protein MSG28_014344 [Choristoneura fumiferana]|uniref:Uncharacterized protein n=1 Tax=Choristoneura fumiferana TaxID=7141 RepID=A0ACC0JHL6_CHOFU|nr:hypothetical protein MSG28_014344 [Choristoneura fumiferana]